MLHTLTPHQPSLPPPLLSSTSFVMLKKTFIQAVPLTQEAFSPYGRVIQHPTEPQGSMTVLANAGTAQRTNYLAEPQSLFSKEAGAKANLCVFRCSPIQSTPISIRMLERHPYSTQAFIPMGPVGGSGQGRYLVVVAATQEGGYHLSK